MYVGDSLPAVPSSRDQRGVANGDLPCLRGGPLRPGRRAGGKAEGSAAGAALGPSCLVIGMSVLLFLAGGLAGFSLHAHPLLSTPDGEDGVLAALAPNAREQTRHGPAEPPDETSKALKRLKELEVLTGKLSQEVDVHKKLTAEAKGRADMAQYDLEEAQIKGRPPQGAGSPHGQVDPGTCRGQGP